MKSKNLIFLLLSAIVLFSQNVFSQNKKDSIIDYVKLYLDAKNTNDLITAYSYFEKEKEEYLNQEYFLGVVYDLIHISKIEHSLNQIFNSEKSAVEGLEYLDSLPKNPTTINYRSQLSNRLGNIMIELQDYKGSIKYYSDVIKYTVKIEDSIIAYNNLGIAYRNLGELKIANENLLLARELTKKNNDPRKVSLVLSNLGLVNALLGNKEKGLAEMLKALEIRIAYKDPQLYETCRDLMDYYLIDNDTIDALKYAKKGYESTKIVGDLTYEERALSSLIKLGQDEYSIEYNEVVERVKENNNQLRDTYASAKYNLNIEKEKTRNAELRAAKNEIRANENEIKANRNMLISVLGAFGFILFIIFLRRKYKNNTLKKQFEIEQHISKKLHDEVANDVFHTMFKVQGEGFSNEELVDDLEVIYNKTRDLSKSITELKVSNNFGQLLEDLVLSYQVDEVNIFTNYLYEVPWDVISKNKKKVLYRVIQELMTNMQKHSLADLVSLSFEKKGNKIITKYADNGVGTKLKKGNGLQNVESRIKMVNGSIKFESEINNGFHVQIIV